MKTKLTIALSLIALAATAYVVPNWKKPATTLAWDYAVGETISGFRLYQGVEPRGYTNVVFVPSTARTYTFTNLAFGTTYYWSATAVGPDGSESDYTNEATNTTAIKWTPPGKLTATNIQL